VGAAIVGGQDLDVLMEVASLGLLVLDSQIRKVDLVIEVGKVMRSGPGSNLILGSIRMAVILVAVAIVLVQPFLVVLLELVVEDDSVDPRTVFLKNLSGIQVGVENLRVMFQLAGALQARIEGL